MATLKDKERDLEILKHEISQAEASLESDFAKHMAEHTDEKLEDLFFSNKVDFYKYILTAQNNYLQDRVGGKVKRAEELNEEIHKERANEDLKSIEKEFKAKHPDADMELLAEFYNEELPPKLKKQVDALEGLEFFEALLAMFKAYSEDEKDKAKKDSEHKPQEELPKEIKGNPSTDAGSSSDENVMTRF